MFKEQFEDQVPDSEFALGYFNLMAHNKQKCGYTLPQCLKIVLKSYLAVTQSTHFSC